MPYLTTDDGVRLYYEDTGSGSPVLFVHEFAGDHRSWEPQVRALARQYRCITYSARGYPPSEVPQGVDRYSQARARDDVLAVLDGLDIDRAHVIGLSMGGFATLHFGLSYPQRATSLVLAGVGYGAEAEHQARFRTEVDAIAAKLKAEGMQSFAEDYAFGPTRVQFENKDPRGFLEFKRMLAEHSAQGSANTQQGIQKERPSLYDLESEMRAMTVPTLIVSGDEDWPCLAPSIYMKRAIGTSALLVVPNTGHTVNLEEPEAFNRGIVNFMTQVESGRFPTRDERAMSESITGVSKQPAQ